VSLVLVDSSVWIAHFRTADPTLQALLAMDRIVCHPFIVLELACGTPPSPREQTLGDLRRLKQCVVATTEEILALIEREKLHDFGCGAVDIALLASARLTPGTQLWTKDRHLDTLARRLGVAFSVAGY
jgi:predicted nucleic acid-binding protein